MLVVDPLHPLPPLEPLEKAQEPPQDVPPLLEPLLSLPPEADSLAAGAAAAAEAGAVVTMVSGPTALATPCGVKRIDVRSAAEMAAAVPFDTVRLS